MNDFISRYLWLFCAILTHSWWLYIALYILRTTYSLFQSFPTSKPS